MGDHSRFKVSAKHQPGQKHHITKMKAFIAIFALLSALAVTRAFELVSSATAGLSVPLLAVGGASTGTTAAAVIPTITPLLVVPSPSRPSASSSQALDAPRGQLTRRMALLLLSLPSLSPRLATGV